MIGALRDGKVAGSNPVASIFSFFNFIVFMQVWFNGRTSAFQAEYVGSIPITCSASPGNIRDFFFLPRYYKAGTALPIKNSYGCNNPINLYFLNK